eukprot:14826921-Alexandrium_andersonii.AAC.1
MQAGCAVGLQHCMLAHHESRRVEHTQELPKAPHASGSQFPMGRGIGNCIGGRKFRDPRDHLPNVGSLQTGSEGGGRLTGLDPHVLRGPLALQERNASLASPCVELCTGNLQLGI